MSKWSSKRDVWSPDDIPKPVEDQPVKDQKEPARTRLVPVSARYAPVKARLARAAMATTSEADSGSNQAIPDVTQPVSTGNPHAPMSLQAHTALQAAISDDVSQMIAAATSNRWDAVIAAADHRNAAIAKLCDLYTSLVMKDR